MSESCVFYLGNGIVRMSRGTSTGPGFEIDCEWAALMTDIPRLHAGRVGGQFWSVWVPPEVTGPATVRMTLEQIDLVRAMVARYPNDLQMAYTADDIVNIHKAGRIASLIGIEGGHQIDNSLPMLRQMYALGARYTS